MTEVQHICFLVRNSKSTLNVIKEVHQDLMKDIKWIKLSKTGTGIVLETPVCNITILNAEDGLSNIIRGLRCNVLVVDNLLRFNEDFVKDNIEPLIVGSNFIDFNTGKKGSDSHGMIIGYHQFMNQNGIAKYANCNRFDSKTQTDNSYERMTRKDYFREDVVRL